jgi:hypothetical protein
MLYIDQKNSLSERVLTPHHRIGLNLGPTPRHNGGEFTHVSDQPGWDEFRSILCINNRSPPTIPISTLPSSTASPRCSSADLARSFECRRTPLDRGQVSEVFRRLARPHRRCRWRASYLCPPVRVKLVDWSVRTVDWPWRRFWAPWQPLVERQHQAEFQR